MQLWSMEHVKTLLPALAVFLLISILLRLWLKEKPWQVRMIPTHVVFIIRRAKSFLKRVTESNLQDN